MNRLACLNVFTFLQNVTLLLVGEGVYFYTHHVAELGFSDTQNLMLALGRGAFFISGALTSHMLTKRLGEKPQLLLTMVGQMAGLGAAALAPVDARVLIGGVMLYSLSCGWKWPVVESYFSAGLTPARQAKAVGWFNLSWSLGAPLGMILAGPIIGGSQPAMLFSVAVAIDVVSLLCVLPLERVPVHLPHDHPERPNETQVHNLTCLLRSSRWSMMASYAMFYTISPLLPGVFDKFDVPVALAAPLSSLLHFGRLAVFVALVFTHRWHGRTWVQWLTILCLPLGFALIVSEVALPIVLGGMVLFGIGAGLAYFSALYYAMVVANASVDASGHHEATIGSGLLVGPLAGLLGTRCAAAMGSLGLGMLIGWGPLLLAITWLSAVPLGRMKNSVKP